MNVFSEFRQGVCTALDGLAADGALPQGLDFGNITVEPPRDAAHGDMATNAAMVLAKTAKMKPRDLAALLCAALQKRPDVLSVEVAGPGFINLRLTDAFWGAQLKSLLAAGVDYGGSTIGANEKINVEYVSANPTGPLHVGHCRGAVFGDALCALLRKVGFDVVEEYYINDAGAQMDQLARSLHFRYREALGEEVGEMPEGLYPGDYLVPPAERLARRDGDKWLSVPENDWIGPLRRFGTDEMMDLIRDDLAGLGIRHDVFFRETELHESGAIERVLEQLTEKGEIYQGVLDAPKGKRPEDWEPRPQTLFRSTDFGDDVDRPLKKSDGAYTYFAADIAYHHNKFSRGFTRMIDVWGADHGGYVKRMKAAVAAISDGKGDLDVKLCQLVKLLRNGEPVRMSKRAGQFVTLRDVVDEVGKDVVRFIMLTRKNDASLDFDFQKVTEQSKDNPVFYVQYAHARVCSVIRNAAELFGDGRDLSAGALAAADVSRANTDDELALIRRLAEWPRVVETAALAHEPHRIAFFLYDLASGLHGLWNKGNEDPSVRFIVADDEELTMARLALIRGVALVIGSGLAVIGVTPAEEMR
jgi:arginyl-tRNA synthetase